MNAKLKINLPKDNNVSRKQTTEPRRYNDQTIVVVCLFVCFLFLFVCLFFVVVVF